jgi:hypothetical protein
MISFTNRPPIYTNSDAFADDVYLGGFDDFGHFIDAYRCAAGDGTLSDVVYLRYGNEPFDIYDRVVDKVEYERAHSMYTLWLYAIRNAGSFNPVY